MGKIAGSRIMMFRGAVSNRLPHSRVDMKEAEPKHPLAHAAGLLTSSSGWSPFMSERWADCKCSSAGASPLVNLRQCRE